MNDSGKRVTVKNVAELSGVSTATVSNVLTGKKYVSSDIVYRVEKAIQELGYVPNATARSLRMNKSCRIGVLAPDISLYFFGEIIKNIQATALKYQYQVVIANTDFDYKQELSQIKSFINAGVDGIINISSMMNKKDIVKFDKTPIVFVDRPDLLGNNNKFDYKNVGFIYTDEKGGAELVARKCLEAGVKKVICLIDQNPLFVNSNARCFCLCDYLKKNGFDEKNILIQDTQLSFESGYSSVLAVLESGFDIRGSALCTGNDESAWGVIEALKKSGYRIPQDAAVIGYDNATFGNYITPRLTTIAKPVKDFGEMAACMLLDVIEGKKKNLNNQRIILPMYLVDRDSI